MKATVYYFKKDDCNACGKKNCNVVATVGGLCFACTLHNVEAIDCSVCSRPVSYIAKNIDTPSGVICNDCYHLLEDEELREEYGLKKGKK